MKHKLKDNGKYRPKQESNSQPAEAEKRMPVTNDDANKASNLNGGNSNGDKSIGNSNESNISSGDSMLSRSSTVSNGDLDGSLDANDRANCGSRSSKPTGERGRTVNRLRNDVNSCKVRDPKTDHPAGPVSPPNDSGLASSDSVNSSIVNRLLTNLNESFGETASEANLEIKSLESKLDEQLNGPNQSDRSDQTKANKVRQNRIKQSDQSQNETSAANGLSGCSGKLGQQPNESNGSVESGRSVGPNRPIRSGEHRSNEKHQINEQTSSRPSESEGRQPQEAKSNGEPASESNEESELNRIKFSIVELHKFCLNIINELQLTHSDLSELKRSLVQKDFFSLLLGNHLLNGAPASANPAGKPFALENFIDAFTGQLLDALMSNLLRPEDGRETGEEDGRREAANSDGEPVYGKPAKDYRDFLSNKENFPNGAIQTTNLSASSSAGSSPSYTAAVKRTLNLPLNRSIGSIASAVSSPDRPAPPARDPLSNRPSSHPPSNSSTGSANLPAIYSSIRSSIRSSIDSAIKSSVDSALNSPTSSSASSSPGDSPTDSSACTLTPGQTNDGDKIYLTRTQFDTLLHKNAVLERRLRISLKALQSLNNELKEAFQNYDYLEISFQCMQNKFKSILNIKKDEYELMKEKINYLTTKLIQVEKAYRQSLERLSELDALQTTAGGVAELSTPIAQATV